MKTKEVKSTEKPEWCSVIVSKDNVEETITQIDEALAINKDVVSDPEKLKEFVKSLEGKSLDEIYDIASVATSLLPQEVAERLGMNMIPVEVRMMLGLVGASLHK